jgi:CubicO group peptidase (beta-lactamase class C family)
MLHLGFAGTRYGAALAAIVLAAVLWAAALSGCATLHPDQVLRVVTGMVSHNLCSEVFVSGLDAERSYAESVRPRPGMSLIAWALDYRVDRSEGEVVATIGGGFESRARFRDGLGCMVEHDPPPAADSILPLPIETTPADLPEIAGTAVVEPTDPRLAEALDAAFAESEDPPDRLTRAVVIVHEGRVVAERYALGIGVDTPLLGYSATKSVLSALAGILVRQGLLSEGDPAPVAAWSGSRDRRRAITVDHLLRMTSGLALDEVGSPTEPVARMLYLERDMAGFAAAAGLETEPGAVWKYTSGNTVLLSRIVRDAVGGDTADVLRFAHRELFGPLGMSRVTLEFDATGTPVGSTYMLAPARDWARFGMLYLDDGIVGGRRILPAGWVRYTSTPTLDTGYGAGFWTNRVEGSIPWSGTTWGIPGVPGDTIFARGLLGQYVVVVPSARLVVVRFGATHRRDADVEGVGRLVSAAIAALG